MIELIKKILNNLLNILLKPFLFSKKDISRDKIQIDGRENKTNIKIINNFNIYNYYSKQEEIKSKYMNYKKEKKL